MADSKRKTANLFDGTYTKGFIGTTYIYKNTNTSANCAIIPCEPSTTYTVKKHDDSNRFAIGTSNVIPYDEIQLTGVYYVDTATEYTFTTDSSAHYMVVYVSTGTEQAEPRLMVNTGSTALPYEPYWRHSLRKLTTATDTLTTLPADLYADGNNATVGLVGNMVQASQPSPTNPVYPQETGDKTANLVYSSQTQTVGTDLQISQTIGSTEYILNKSETEIAVSTATLCDMTLQAGTYTITVSGINRIADDNTFDRVFVRDSDNNIVVQDVYDDIPKTFTLSETTTLSKIIIVAHKTSTYNNNRVTIMLNSGSTALPYEPYGVEIPISSANTTTPVYLGGVETTRKIKQVVLTGQEDLSIYGASTSGIGFYFAVNDMMSDSRMNGYSSHFKAQITPSRSTIDGITFGASNRIVYVTFSDTSVSALNLSDITSIKQYIADQYSAGTPVTIWYVLATPTTGIVNEPIRKIGNYADTVSGISIPTITGKDAFDVLTTLKPSEVSLAYTGWHDASVGEWDGSEWT